jgi:hypothetical protein
MKDGSDKTPGMAICYWSYGGMELVSFYHYRDERVTMLGVMLLAEFIKQLTSVTSGNFLHTVLPQEKHNLLFWNSDRQSFAITWSSSDDEDFGAFDNMFSELLKKGDSLTELDTIYFWKKGDGGDDDDTDEIQFFCDSWGGEPSYYIGGCYQLGWLEENDRLQLELVRARLNRELVIRCGKDITNIVVEYAIA